MLNRGRKSAASLAIATADNRRSPRLDPPSFLSEAGRSLFADVVASCPPKHFVRSDIEMLATYVTAILAVREAAGDPEAFNKWERAARLQASVAVRLRLTPSSRPPKLVPDDGPFPWDTEED